MKHAQPARLELKMRTVFNLLGPLTNPAGATRQLIGAPSLQAAELMAQALDGLKPERAFVVHGSDGLDEVTTTGPTTVFEVTGEGVRRFEWTPVGFRRGASNASDLSGGDRTKNCAIASYDPTGPSRRSAGNCAGERGSGLAGGRRSHGSSDAMRRASESIDSGAAWKKVERLRVFTSAEPATRN